MQSDHRAAQLPFWPGMHETAKLANKAKAARTPRPATAPRAASSATSKRAAAPETPAERAVRLRLQERLSARVALKNRQGRGSFTVYFTSYDELDEIMRRIDA